MYLDYTEEGKLKLDMQYYIANVCEKFEELGFQLNKHTSWLWMK